MPKTIKTEPPPYPDWVARAGSEARWAWEYSLSWRAAAAQATPAYREQLILDAKWKYHRGAEPVGTTKGPLGGLPNVRN